MMVGLLSIQPLAACGIREPAVSHKQILSTFRKSAVSHVSPKASGLVCFVCVLFFLGGCAEVRERKETVRPIARSG